MLQISTVERDGAMVVTVAGRVDSATAREFENALIPPIEGGQRFLVVDFSNVDYISSSGLRVLLMSAKRMSAAQGIFRLCGVSDQVLNVLEIAGFTRIVSISDDLEAALQAP